MKKDPWERIEHETTEAYADFCCYLNLGPTRTIPKVAELRNKNVKTLWQSSSRYKWVKRAEAYDEHIEQKVREVMERKIMQVKEAALTGAMKMTELGLKKLNSMKETDLTPREAKEYVRNGLAIVQLISGESEEAKEAVLEMPNDNDVVVYLPEIDAEVVRDGAEAREKA